MPSHTAIGQPFSQLLPALRSGQLSLHDYLTQLETHFHQREPDVIAFVHESGRFNRLRQDADKLLQQFPDPDQRPPLFGLPVGVKDIFHIDGFPTQAGSQLPPGILQGDEAPCVTQLKAAGALIFGKTVTTEFAYFGPGPTRNPHNPEHTPGGSSSGSAAAVSAHLTPLTLGTQTIGSVNRPAAFCGAVGYKPSYGRIDKTNVIPLAPSVDHVGLFTNHVADLTHAAAILCQAWQPNPTNTKPTLAIPEGPYLNRADSVGIAHFRTLCDQLRDAGYTVKAISIMADFDTIYDRHQQIVAAEAAYVHQTWFPAYGHLYHQKTVDLIERGHQVDKGTLTQALASCTTLRQTLTDTMSQHGIDLWLSPPAPGTAPHGLASTGNPVMNLPWTHSGLPTLTLSAGHHHGLPLGLQLTAAWYQDEALLAWGQQLEATLKQLYD